MRSMILTCMLTLVGSVLLCAQTGDVLGMHDLSVGGKSPVQMPGALGCTFCHAPHSGLTGTGALWNQKLSTQTYSPYASSTYRQSGKQPVAGDSTSLCLSCHDGTVAIGQSPVYGNMQAVGKMYSYDVLGTELQSSHPISFNLPMADASHLAASLVASGTTADKSGAVKLINKNVECNSCHNPHVQSVDRYDARFLVIDNSYSRLCLSCHDPQRTATGVVNPLAGWGDGAHALATNKPVADAHVGPYDMVGKNGCLGCHMPHSALGKRLLRPANPEAVNLDAVTQSCVTCHAGGSNLNPAAPNIAGELAKISHPLPGGNNSSSHDAAESVVLNNNRHATCTDCHNPHGSKKVEDFTNAPLIRNSQYSVSGVKASDGTVLNAAANQYENCLRCHGASAGKQSPVAFGYTPIRAVAASDALDVTYEFQGSSSGHPVMHDRNSAFAQPSLLPYMRDIEQTKDLRAMGSSILCTDCHNSDDNREFGKSGPNGPHGSIFPHILERQYKYNDLAVGGAPGSAIQTLYKPLDLSATGPYALCAKCHNLNSVMSNASFTQHSRHIGDGFACATCHTPHGMGATNANVSGERMVNFDTKLVGQNGTAPISYDRSTSSCTLTCHNHKHPGTVTAN